NLSGGLVTNIGIHFFDLLIWLFGRVEGTELHVSEDRTASGFLELERATVKWYLSVDRRNLPFEAVPGRNTTHRSLTDEGKEIEFCEGFGDLHTVLYREILAGRGFGVEDARPSIVLTQALRNAKPVGITARSHPWLGRK